ncbi:PAS domain-containing protein [Mariannaea sp. PMI_226]|nr:PAS domain-containing protein [Mariannaea sp. PMI_226]
MDGFYPPNQLPQQQQQPQQQPPQPPPPQPPPPQQQQQYPQHHQQQPQPMHHGITNDPNLFAPSDSLDDIVQSNQTELHRRRSMPQAFGNPLGHGQDAPRRMSAVLTGDMMAFGGGQNNFGMYQFNQAIPTGFPTMNTNIDISNQLGTYGTDYQPVSGDMMGSMIPSTFANMSVGQVGSQMGADAQVMNLFSAPANSMPPPYPPQLGTAAPNFATLTPDESSISTTPTYGPPVAPTAAITPTPALESSGNSNEDIIVGPPPLNVTDVGPVQGVSSIALDPSTAANPKLPMPPLSRNLSGQSGSMISTAANSRSSTQAATTSVTTTPANAGTPIESKDKTVYSKSGFDMLKALWLVATRKNPKINLGAVDMSCAFVVCDVTMNDCPIIYVSDNFQNLTGYSRHEIVGQNCRFLQAPDGKVEAGSKREFVDDGAVFNLKKMIHEGKEVQQSLINYRKGGKPFLNLLTMIPIPWDTDEIRYFIGFQIDLVECPDAISPNQGQGGMEVNYKHNDIGQYIWTPPTTSNWEPENGQTLGIDEVSSLLQQFNPKGHASDWHKQTWDKMLLENTDDVVHVLSLKGLFLYLSPASKRVLEYDATELVGNSLSTVCHPSDIVPVTRELKDTTSGSLVNIVFRIRRKHSGYTWFESHGSLFVEQGKGRKCIILVGRKRPVFALSRQNMEANGGIGDSEMWTKLSTSGLFLFVSSNIRSLLDLQPDNLVGTSIQDLMRKESRPEFGRSIEKARRGKTVTCKHEVQNRRGQVLQAQTTLYPGDAAEGQKPSFLLAQTKLIKASSRHISSGGSAKSTVSGTLDTSLQEVGKASQPVAGSLALGSQDAALASDDNIFDELRTTKCSSWQFELRQMEKVNRILAEELGGLLTNKKKRKRRKGVGNVVRDCANCHTRNTPEWRRGPSGQRDLCNSCGLRWAKQTGRVSPRNSSRGGNNGHGDAQSKKSNSPIHHSPVQNDITSEMSARRGTDGNGDVQPAQLFKQTDGTVTAPSGAPSATGVLPSTTVPPMSLSSMTAVSGMTSIREERELSQQ